MGEKHSFKMVLECLTDAGFPRFWTLGKRQ
jgi:hypothetical protein